MPLLLTGLFIFGARVADMSLATFRILMLMRGQNLTAAAIGFFESAFYIVALIEVIKHVNNPINVLFFAGGFAAGNYVGGYIEERVAIGYVNAQIISVKSYESLKKKLRNEGFGVTAVEGCGKEGVHYVLYVMLKRRHLPKMMRMVEAEDPHAFISVMDTRKIVGGFFTKRKFK